MKLRAGEPTPTTAPLPSAPLGAAVTGGDFKHVPQHFVTVSWSSLGCVSVWYGVLSSLNYYNTWKLRLICSCCFVSFKLLVMAKRSGLLFNSCGSVVDALALADSLAWLPLPLPPPGVGVWVRWCLV